MASQAGSSFQKAPSVASVPSATAPKRGLARVRGVRILPDHPMSIADSYLYTYTNAHAISMLNSMGGVEIGLGPGYTNNINDLPHVHTGAVLKVENGEVTRIF